MMQLVAKRKMRITPFVHKVHIHVMYYDGCICTYSKGEGALHTPHSSGTRTYLHIFMFEDKYDREEIALYSRGERAHHPLYSQVHMYDICYDIGYVRTNTAQEKEPTTPFMHKVHIYSMI